MKKIFLFLFVQALTANFLFAQAQDLFVRSEGKGLSVEHKVTPKENFYSIGRLFNISPKLLASFNSLDMAKGLSIGQVIRIPLTDSNFSQKTDQGVPLYVKSGDKESLSRISAMNNKVPVENLRRWNNISGDNVNAGTKLIVGFLVAGELAKSNSITIVKKEEPIDNSTVKEKKADEVKKTEPLTNVNPVKEENKAIVKEEPKKEEPAKIESKVETATMPEAGYFKDNFEQQVKVYPLSKDETVTSGLFKTSSGWKDAKYYALIDGIEPGTIIKITNPSNNKSVYAKVLGQMSGIRQNQGLDIRISDAAVSALQIADSDKFIVKVNY